jgi:hypothetical protein
MKRFFGLTAVILIACWAAERPASAQNYEFKADFGGACTIGVVSPDNPSPYP